MSNNVYPCKPVLLYKSGVLGVGVWGGVTLFKHFFVMILPRVLNANLEQFAQIINYPK